MHAMPALLPRSCPCADEAMKVVSGLVNLESLDAFGARITDAGCAALRWGWWCFFFFWGGGGIWPEQGPVCTRAHAH